MLLLCVWDLNLPHVYVRISLSLQGIGTFPRAANCHHGLHQGYYRRSGGYRRQQLSLYCGFASVVLMGNGMPVCVCVVQQIITSRVRIKDENMAAPQGPGQQPQVMPGGHMLWKDPQGGWKLRLLVPNNVSSRTRRRGM